MIKKFPLACLVLAASITGVQAAGDATHTMPAGHDHASMHAQMMAEQTAASPESSATEPGQGAFATIAEIVTILRNDPATDWRQVNIDALREHLIDMDQLTLYSRTEVAESQNNTLEFDVRGDGRTIGAIHRMVPAHAPFVAAETGWKTSTKLLDDGVLLTVQTNSEADAQMLKAIGFYGFMALGAHHQPHHEAMARGQAVHQH